MSAQPVFTTAAIATFNVLWTSLPTVAFACFDQDVSPATSLAHPELYRETSKYSKSRFLLDALAWLVSASWHSLWCLFACLAVLGDPEASTADGKQWDLFAVGIAVFTAAVVACDAKVAIRTNHWTAFNALAVIGSVCAWFPFVELVSDAYVSFGVFASVSGVAEALFPEPRFWLAIVLAVVGAVVPDAVAEVYLRFVAPKDWHILREACDEAAAKKAKKARDRAKAVKKARYRAAAPRRGRRVPARKRRRRRGARNRRKVRADVAAPQGEDVVHVVRLRRGRVACAPRPEEEQEPELPRGAGGGEGGGGGGAGLGGDQRGAQRRGAGLIRA